jgi:hypothetical protein
MIDRSNIADGMEKEKRGEKEEGISRSYLKIV